MVKPSSHSRVSPLQRLSDARKLSISWVVPRRELFVPVEDEEFLFSIDPALVGPGDGVNLKGGTNERTNHLYLLERRSSSSTPPWCIN